MGPITAPCDGSLDALLKRMAKKRHTSALQSGTDKVTTHNYDVLYSKGFLQPARKPLVG
jgi:hypothetical protein